MSKSAGRDLVNWGRTTDCMIYGPVNTTIRCVGLAARQREVERAETDWELMGDAQYQYSHSA